MGIIIGFVCNAAQHKTIPISCFTAYTTLHKYFHEIRIACDLILLDICGSGKIICSGLEMTTNILSMGMVVGEHIQI